MAKNRKRNNPQEGTDMSLIEEDKYLVEGTDAESVEAEDVNTQEVDNEAVEPEQTITEPAVVEPEIVEPAIQEPEVVVTPEAVVEDEKLTPPPAAIKEKEIEQLSDKHHPAVLVMEAFDKKSINALINSYMDIEVDDSDIGIYNTIENKKARALIAILSEAAANTEYTMAIKTLAHLSIFMMDIKKEKDSGLLFQLLVQDFNNAKDVAEIDMSIYVLTRLFKHVRSFSFPVILKGINTGYHPEFKVNVLQMHEVFRQLSTKADRDLKIDKTISFANKKDGRGKAFNVSNVFLNQNGSKLLTQYFTDK